MLRDLEVHGRELLTVQILGELPAELRVTPERDQRLVQQASTLAQTDAVRLLELVSSALEATANGAQPRIQLELVLIKAAAPEMDPSTSALFARLERLERGGLRPVTASAATTPAQGTSVVATDEVTSASSPAPTAEPEELIGEPEELIGEPEEREELESEPAASATTPAQSRCLSLHQMLRRFLPCRLSCLKRQSLPFQTTLNRQRA